MRSSILRNNASLVLLLGLGCALPAHADWKRDYDRGLRAFEKQNWSDAEAAFRAALAEEATPDARKRFQGVRTAVYVPHYYAGVAAWRQGACDRAMQYWSNTASTTVVAGVSALDAEQERGTLDCRARIAAAAKTAPVTTVSNPPPSSTATPLPPPGATTTPPPVTTKTAANAAPPTIPAQRPATSPASDPGATTATRPPPVAPPSTTATAVPAPLVEALDHYLAGRYDALLQLDPTRLADGRSRAQAHLLRAAARHRRAELDGSDAQLDDARCDIRSARAANASLVPDAAWFPPRFMAFWGATR